MRMTSTTVREILERYQIFTGVDMLQRAFFDRTLNCWTSFPDEAAHWVRGKTPRAVQTNFPFVEPDLCSCRSQ